MPRGYYAEETPMPPEVVATGLRVMEHGVDDTGAVALMNPFWSLVRRDLHAGDAPTHRWLATDDFAQWVTVCGADPETVRQRLLDCSRPPARR